MAETIKEISLDELHPFPDHPFGVRDDDAMQETVESIKEYGVLVPAIARHREDGGYEIIAGHRRKHACQLAGLKTMPVIVRDLDRNAATIIMLSISSKTRIPPLSFVLKATHYCKSRGKNRIPTTMSWFTAER